MLISDYTNWLYCNKSHVYRCDTSSLNALGTEDTGCCSFSEESVSIPAEFLLLNSPWLLLSGSPLHDAPTFSIGDICGLQAGQSSTHTLCVWSHAVGSHVEWGLVSSCWKNHRSPGKRRHLDGSIWQNSKRLNLAPFILHFDAFTCLKLFCWW